MKKVFATLLTATFLLTSCTAVNESTVSSVSETEISSSETTTTVESTALFEKADQYPVFKVVIKGSFLRSEKEYGENIIAGLQEGSEVIVLKEYDFFSLVYTQDGLIGYVDCSNIQPTGEYKDPDIDPSSAKISSRDDAAKALEMDSNVVLPDDTVLNQSYPVTLVRSKDSDYQQKLLPVLLGNDYKKTVDSDDQIQCESTDPSMPYRYVWITKANGNLWFYDAMVTGERGGEYKAPSMNMTPEESLPIAQKKAAEILGEERVAIPSQSYLKHLHISYGDEATYKRATREDYVHMHVFERQTEKGINILDGGTKVRIGVNGISDLVIDCSKYEIKGSVSAKPISLDEALKAAGKICYNNSTKVFYAELVYSNRVSGNDDFNLSWYLVTNKGNYVVDCVLKTAVCDVDTYG